MDSIFRYFSAEEKPAVLRHADQWLTDGDVVSLVDQNAFHVSGNGRGDILAYGRMILASAS